METLLENIENIHDLPPRQFFFLNNFSAFMYGKKIFFKCEHIKCIKW